MNKNTNSKEQILRMCGVNPLQVYALRQMLGDLPDL